MDGPGRPLSYYAAFKPRRSTTLSLSELCTQLSLEHVFQQALRPILGWYGYPAKMKLTLLFFAALTAHVAALTYKSADISSLLVEEAAGKTYKDLNGNTAKLETM